MIYLASLSFFGCSIDGLKPPFAVFGFIHPFLDGNGHIQRLILAACVFERADIELLQSWTIHPRPYGEDVALAFEKPELKARLVELKRLLSSHVRPISVSPHDS